MNVLASRDLAAAMIVVLLVWSQYERHCRLRFRWPRGCIRVSRRNGFGSSVMAVLAAEELVAVSRCWNGSVCSFNLAAGSSYVDGGFCGTNE